MCSGALASRHGTGGGPRCRAPTRATRHAICLVRCPFLLGRACFGRARKNAGGADQQRRSAGPCWNRVGGPLHTETRPQPSCCEGRVGRADHQQTGSSGLAEGRRSLRSAPAINATGTWRFRRNGAEFPDLGPPGNPALGSKNAGRPIGAIAENGGGPERTAVEGNFCTNYRKEFILSLACLPGGSLKTINISTAAVSARHGTNPCRRMRHLARYLQSRAEAFACR